MYKVDQFLQWIFSDDNDFNIEMEEEEIDDDDEDEDMDKDDDNYDDYDDITADNVQEGKCFRGCDPQRNSIFSFFKYSPVISLKAKSSLWSKTGII